MFRLFCYMFLVFASCSGSPLSSQILGGNDADITSFPYMLSIESFGLHSCGGVIVSANWVLTDANCALEPVDVTDYTIRSGSAVLGEGTLHNVIQWIYHPQNDVTNEEYDFALVQVDPPFAFGANVAAVTLASQDQDTPVDADAIISGWGTADKVKAWTSSQLQYATLTVLGEAACSTELGANFHYSKLCAQDPNGVATDCFRDEGGALVVDGTAFGIILWPGYCADAVKVQVYARIASVRDWIDSTIAG